MSATDGPVPTQKVRHASGKHNYPEQAIVIALDASDQAEHAVKFYLERMHRPGNRVVFVHCVELPEMSLEKAKDSHMSPGVLAGMWKEEEAKTKILEAKMKGLLMEKSVPGVLRTATGRPGEVICRVAEEENAAMIVTGTRGMGKVRRTILGSVSDFLVHHAVCPVVVCRRPCDIKKRHASGSEGKKSRHSSGESFTTSIRKRFSSGGNKAKTERSQSVSSDQDLDEAKENQALTTEGKANKEKGKQ